MHRYLYLLLCLALLSGLHSCSAGRPVVFMHGIAATHQDLNHAIDLVNIASKNTTYSISMPIGDGNLASWTPLTKQISEACSMIQSNNKLWSDPRGFNMFCVSQGGLICRGVIETCPGAADKVHNFVSYHSPQSGMWGVPMWSTWCPSVFGKNTDMCNWPIEKLEKLVYADLLQSTTSVFQYWKDPTRFNDYLTKSHCLAHLDNMHIEKGKRVHKEEYRQNLMKLNKLVLVHSTVDKVVVPKESTHWAFFAVNSTKTIVPLRESEIYVNDYIGLKQLDKRGAIEFFSSNLVHADDHSPEFDVMFKRDLLHFLLD